MNGDLEPSDYHHEAEGYKRWRVKKGSERRRAARKVAFQCPHVSSFLPWRRFQHSLHSLSPKPLPCNNPSFYPSSITIFGRRVEVARSWNSEELEKRQEDESQFTPGHIFCGPQGRRLAITPGRHSRRQLAWAPLQEALSATFSRRARLGTLLGALSANLSHPCLGALSRGVEHRRLGLGCVFCFYFTLLKVLDDLEVVSFDRKGTKTPLSSLGGGDTIHVWETGRLCFNTKTRVNCIGIENSNAGFYTSSASMPTSIVLPVPGTKCTIMVKVKFCKTATVERQNVYLLILAMQVTLRGPELHLHLEKESRPWGRRGKNQRYFTPTDSSLGSMSSFGEELLSRNWKKLATYPTPVNIAVVGEQCQYALNVKEGTNFEDIESALCVPEGHFQRNPNGAAINIKRADMTPLAKYWMAFSHANVQPCSHVSDITIHRIMFIYCMLRGLNVNIGEIIANDIQSCTTTVSNKAPLGHPSLITHLCHQAGVGTSTPPFERPRKAIDAAYYMQYCGGDEAAGPVPQRRPRRGADQQDEPAHHGEPFQMRDMYMSMMEAKLEAIRRGQVATAERIVGCMIHPLRTGGLWMSSIEKAQGSGAGAAKAPVMDDDEEDEDFEDAKAEDDDDDSDDNMG
ncbi:hypothetical protein V8G54_032721 [Vigna mungo]|uniref:Putative plant transposon protein domain-containing protein n=1 Tax=Vigna mungo TaxID=3915 RepID=A0AAQ3RFK0_VIGMU